MPKSNQPACRNLNEPVPNWQPHSPSRRNCLLRLGLACGSALTAFVGGNRSVLHAAQQRDRIDALLAEFAETFQVPGMSLAMSQHGQMVLQHCWGWADREKQEALRTDHRLRIASLSKPITSLTIFRLIEQGRITLQTCPFAEPKLLRPLLLKAGLSQERQQELTGLTVQHLLEHVAGGWGNKKQDPMFDSRAIQKNHAELIVWTLQNVPLQHPPGSHYQYSNFGYCLLGRVIEQITGKNYELAVQELVCRPAGVPQMCLAAEQLRQQQENECRYYGQQEDPYHAVMRVRRMDAHGGWLATPSELVKLLCRFDLFPDPPDLLSRNSLKTMTQPCPVHSGYAKGWSVNAAGNWWHMGSFNGASGVWVRTADGWCWALLVNTRSRAEHYLSELDQLPWKIRELLTSA